MIHFIKALQSYAIELGYRVHALTRLYNMRSAFINLLGMLLLLFKIDNLTYRKYVVLVTLIIFGYLLIGYTDFLTYRLKRITRSYPYRIVLIIDRNRVQCLPLGCRLIDCRMMGHELVVTRSLVIQIEPIELNNLYQSVGITWIRGITTSL